MFGSGLIPAAVQGAILAQSGAVPEQFIGCGPGVICPGSVLTAIGAAYQTMGMWVQADLIYYLTYTQFGLWAPLVYILAAIGGMVSLAIGMPPKTYIWFFLGPAVYSWLLGSTVQVHGTEWQVGTMPQDQREVWKNAEVGLVNSGIAERLDREGGVRFSAIDGPTRAVEVSHFFVWFDEVISSSIQWLVYWTGVYSQGGNERVAKSSTNIPGIYNNEYGGRFDGGQWHLLSNLKWKKLEDITGAKLASAEMRDSLNHFMASECGEALQTMVSPQAFAAAQNNKALSLPESIFAGGGNYERVRTALLGAHAAMPPTLKRFLKARPGVATALGDIGSFRQFMPGYEAAFDAMIDEEFNEIRCDDFFIIMVNALRWEAGQIYHQLTSPMYEGLTRDQVVYNLFYGWSLQGVTDMRSLDRFLQDLIFVHILRNELSIANKLYRVRHSSGTETIGYVTTNSRQISSKNKYGEVYMWALMMPYMQGLLLYILAIAYPFFCIIMIVPGHHKALMTWMSFWAWAKLWDVGFAVCMVLERSVWATIGNNTQFALTSPVVSKMGSISSITVGCPPGSLGNSCAIPIVCDKDCAPGVVTATNSLIALFDQGMLLASSLQLDLANSYYIYIMAAMYFAVPAITGQAVLGAKSGVSSMVSTAIGGVAGEAGKGAGSGFGGDITNRLKQGQQGSEAGFKTAALRKSGLAEQALNLQNQGMEQGMMGSALGARQQLAGAHIEQAAIWRQMGQMQGDVFARGLTSSLSAMDHLSNGFNKHFGEKPRSDPSIPKSDPTSGRARPNAQAGEYGATAQEQGPGGTPMPNAPVGGARNSPGRGGLAGGATGAGTGGIPNSGGGTGGDGTDAAALSVDGKGKPHRPFAPRAVSAADTGVEIATGVGNELVGLANAAYAADIMKRSFASISGTRANQNDWGVGAFGRNQSAEGYKQAGQRTGGFAEYKAAMDTWIGMNNLSSDLAGFNNVVGGFAGGVSASGKPLNQEGLGMSGQLGAGAKSAAWWTMPGSRGGFFDGVRQQQGMLQQGFGGGSVWAQYNSIGFMQAGAHMASTFGNLMGEVGFGAKADPKSSLEGVTGKQLSDITRNGRVSTMNGTDATILSDLLGKGLDPVAAPIGKNLDTPQPAASNFAAPAQRSGLLGR